MIYRVDTFEVKPSKRLDNGFLVAGGRTAKVGVLTYRNPDGSSRREYVPEEEITRTDSLGSIGLAPVTDRHPESGLITRDNAAIETKGVSLQRVKYLDGYVEVEILITDPNLADKVERGDAQELSLGYTLERLDETPGEHPEFGPYDAIQRGRIANHIAVVKRGRAGPGARLRVDEKDSEIAFYHDCLQDQDMPQKEDEKNTTDGANDQEANKLKDRQDEQPDLTDALDTLQTAARDIATSLAETRADEDGDEGDAEAALEAIMQAMGGFVEKMDAVKSRANEQMQKYDEMKAQLDALMGEFTPEKNEDAMGKEDRQDAADGVEDKGRQDAAPQLTREDMLDWHNERKDLEQVADDMRLDSYEDLGNDELRKKIVEEHFGEERADACAAEIRGEYKAVKAIRKKRADSYDRASQTVVKGRNQGTKSRSDSAQERYKRRLMNGGVDPEESRNDSMEKFAEALAAKLQ